MRRIHRRHDRLRIVAPGLLAGVLFLILAPTMARPQPAGTPRDGTAGFVWRLVRSGGGGGRFVAVGGDRTVYSSDGDRWQPSLSYDLWDLRGVTWGNDRFVAVGDNGTIAHSKDGSRWRRVRKVATRAELQGVTWGGGRFVAVGSDGTVVQSADGESWQSVSDTGTAATLTGVAVLS